MRGCAFYARNIALKQSLKTLTILIKSTYKFSNDMVIAWRNFQKNSCGISTYHKLNFKPQISFIFHFERLSDGPMARVLGVKEVD